MTQVSLSTSTNYSGDLNALVEDQGTELTIRLDLDEPAPTGGLRVFVDSDVEQIINRLDLPGFAFNPVTQNIDSTSVSTDFDNSGVALTIDEGAEFASFTIPVFDNTEPDTTLPETFDGLVEATLSVVTADGVSEEDATNITGISEYTVAAEAASSVVLFADDESQLPTDNGNPPTGELPVVSFEAIPTTISEEAGAEDRLLVLQWTVEGEIPEEGLVVNFDNLFGITDQLDSEDDRAASNNLEFASFDRENNRIGIRLLANEASFDLPIINDVIEENTEFNFILAPGEGYVVDPEQNSTLFTITDDNGGAGVGPTVGISVSETELAEGDEFTVTFNVEGEIPEGGVEVLVESSLTGALGLFDIANLDNLVLSGIDVPVPGDTTGSSFIVNIVEPNATITLSVFDDITAEEIREAPFELVNGELYEVDPDAAGFTLNISDEEQPAGPTVGLTVDKTDVTEGETITLTFNVEGEIPEGGVQVLVNDVASADGGLRSLSEFDITNVETTGIGEFPTPAEGDSGFFVNITEPNATITLPVFDDGADEVEANESFTFEVIDGEAYNVDPNAASITLNISDAEGGGGDEPVVSFSTTPELISEADGTELVMNFSVEGEIPEGGITVNLEGDTARIMEEFTVAQTRVNDDGTFFNRFDTGFADPANGFIVGGILDRFSLEDGDRSEELADPAAAGDAYLTNFSFTITEQSASITIPVIDDILQEADETFTYTLVEGEGYTVDNDASTGTFTVTDGIEVAAAPVVGVTATPATLVEAEQSEFTVTFNTEGEIPPEGLVVVLEGPVIAIAEFDVNATNPRLPESETEVEGVTVTGGNIVGTDEVAGSLFFRITEPTATVSVPVFLDFEEEGTENLTFNLRDGELYDVDSSANAIAVTIEDGVVAAPVVTVDTVAATFDAEDNIIAPYLVDSLEDGTPILSVVIETEGIFPPDGLVVNINSDLEDISQFVAEPAFAPFVFGGEFISAVYDDAGTATGFQVRLDNPRAIVSFSNVGLEAEEVEEFNLFVDSGEGYEVSDSNSAPVTVYSTLEQTPTTPEPASVGIEIAETTLIEGDNATTISFDVDGDIPEGGLIVSVDSGARFSLGEFDLFDAEVTGGTFPITNGGASGFFFKITEPTASITLTAADDNRNPETGETSTEGIEAFTFALLEQPGYSVSSDAAAVSFTVADDADSQIQVSLLTEPQILIEEEGTVSVHTFNLSSAPPEEGVTVRVLAEGLEEFDPTGLETTGIAGEVSILESDPPQLSFTITEQTATISLPVANDGVAEGLETATFTLAEPGEDAEYQISSDPEANQSSFNIYDTINETPLIVESVESDDTIATSVPIAINGERNTALVKGEIDFNFGNNRDVDQTEDVDMYSVELQEGDRLTLDVDSIPYTNSEGFVLEVGGNLRLFNEAGEELVFNAEGSAPGEVLESGRDAYIDFTAESAGTYYIGVSQAFNEDYDPNVKGTGDGAILPPRFGVGAGAYELNVDINPDEPTFEQFEEFDGETVSNAPTVSFTAVPGTFQGNDIISSQIIESLGVGRGQAALLNFTFNVEGDIPEEGIEVVAKSDTDFTDFLDDLNGTPRTAVGGSILGAVYNEDGSVAGFRALLTAANASFPFSVLDREDDNPDAPESIEFSLANSEDYAVDSDINTSDITFYDTLEQVQSKGNVPQVGISIDQTELVETEGTEVNISFNVDGDIPEGGLLVYLDSETRGAIGEFDVFNAEITGGSFPSPNGDASGFYFLIQENTANINLQVFDETTNPEIPAENAQEGIESFSFSLIESGSYTIAPDAADFTFTIADNPDSVEIIQPDILEEEGPTDNDGRGNNNDTIANAVPLGLNPAVDALSVTIDGEIGDRFRGEDTVDNTEDVDFYSFDLQEGQTITIDIDANGIGDAGLSSILDSNLRIFDESGNELVINGQGAAPDEIFQAEGDPYLEFTAPETGTYYASISALGNDFYDPNVVASGSGWTFGESFGADIYQVTFSLGEVIANPEPETPTPVFGTIDGDTIEVEGSNQLIFAGDMNDLVDVSRSVGNNRIYAGDGDDVLISGSNNRIFGEEGDDRFFFTSGGDNTITGGTGADQFWIASAEIPKGANIITDFTAGEDVIGIAGLGIGFEDVSITASEGDALIAASGSDLAILQGVAADSLTESDFAFS